MKTLTLSSATLLLYALGTSAAPAPIEHDKRATTSAPISRVLFKDRSITRVLWKDRTATSAGPTFYPAPVSNPKSSAATLSRPVTTTSSRAATTTTMSRPPTSSATTTSRPATTTSRAATTTSTRAPTTSAAGSPLVTVSSSSRTTTTTSAAPTSTAGADIRTAVLDEHNRFRALHGAAPLTWSQTQADAAASWASHCVFQHSQGAVGPYGENLAANAGEGTGVAAALAGIQLWEDEAPNYDPANPTYSHFTQMVWKSATKLGCALQVCAPGSIFDAQYGNSEFLVCEYDTGNVIGQFAQNVQP
ncbi:RHTO0S11e06722g2_1 [Rhodotorula toruloides]|uniref:RHTO0S11e06722g2_1 n=1 Tax=Rhodotorula toruloides TaxID=5286 RepID=A0A061B7S8_RHOTO|nr:RHTO0S11e06722g2_1 [Rhodotorula toruloides]